MRDVYTVLLICVHGDGISIPALHSDNVYSVMQPRVRLEDFTDAVRHLLPKTSCGTGGISLFIAKGCCKALTLVLLEIVWSSFSTSSFPTSWKEPLIVPVFKAAPHNAQKYYRPISLLSSFAKVETVIHTQLSCFQKLPT